MASMSSSAAMARVRRASASPVREHLAHALEVLVDPDGHQLHLEAELLELGGELLAQLRHVRPPTRTGR